MRRHAWRSPHHVVSGLLVCAVAACSDSTGTSFSPTAPLALTAGLHRTSAGNELVSVTAAVRAGNAQAIAAAPALVPPGVPLAPFVEARLYAIANVAMHDALNAVAPRYDRYADAGPLVREADATVAVLTAARDAIVGASPGATAAVDAWYTNAMLPLASVNGRAAGVAVGRRAAAAILARRASDGTAGGGVAPFVPLSGAGDYRFTFPFNTPGFDFFGTGGFVDGSAWASSVTPFVIRSASQFRAPRPYLAINNSDAVRTRAYTRDYDEVQRLGCDGCAARSTTQTEIAKFWVESSPAAWNRIARTIADQENLSAHETARLFALLQLGQFDAYTTSLESKYHYRFWRPVSAVELATTDGNDATATTAGWQVLVFPTPPIPEYPSAHATAGGSAAAIIESVVRGRIGPFSTTSTSLPGATRHFGSVAQAARENADSRVYVGYHFRHATDVGLLQGWAVGWYVARTALQRRDD